MLSDQVAQEQLTGRERRQSELALVAWEGNFSGLGRSPTLSELLAAINTEEWSYGFVVAVDPVVEISSLLMYGANFARLMDMPQRGMPFVKMTRQLPPRYAEIFLRGCTDACTQNIASQIEGEVVRDDGRTELYRAVFIPVEPVGDAEMRFAFGRFNCRIDD